MLSQKEDLTLLDKRLLNFKEKFKEKYLRWNFYYTDDLPEILQKDTVYLVIKGEEHRKKQKTIDFSINFCKTKVKDGLIKFRTETVEFLKFMQENFETVGIICVDGAYNIQFFSDEEQLDLRISEITCTFDFTQYREISEDWPNMENLKLKGGME